MVDGFREVNRLSMNCMRFRDCLNSIRWKLDVWKNKPDEQIVSYVGNEEDGVMVSIDRETVIRELERSIDSLEAELKAEKKKLIDMLEIIKEEYEGN